MTTTITVEGMTCGHCEQTVEGALQDVSGVTDVTVDKRINERLRRSGHSDSVITIPSLLEGDPIHTLEFVQDNDIIKFS